MDLTPEERKARIDSIPEAAVGDGHNENIQPRRQGRSVVALNRVLGMSSTEREEAIRQGKSRFQEQLQIIDEIHDPLDVYVQHVAWLFEMYPDGSAKDELLTVIHDATNKFYDRPQYKSDFRYLKLWIEYSRWVEKPIEIFAFLIKNGIGQNLGLFYEEYSSLFEKQEKYNEAIKAYEMGIEKEALPVRRLERNLISLKSRIEARRQKGLIKMREQEARRQMSALKETGQRTMLGQKFDARSRTSMAANVFVGIQSTHGSPSRSQGSFGNDGFSISSNTSSKIAVFKDEPSSSSSSTNRSLLHRTTKISLHPNKARISFQPTPTAASEPENRLSAESFTGVVIPQAEIERPVIEPFSVYRDGQEPSPKRRIERQYSSMLSESSGEESTISKIRKLSTTEAPSVSKRSETKTEEEIRMAEHFKRNERLYFKSRSTKGQIEIMTVLKTTHSRSCFEEDRIYQMGIKFEKPDDGDDFDLYFKRNNIPAPDVGYTTETRKAVESVDQQLYGQNPVHSDDEDITWTSPYQKLPIKKKKIINENE